MSTVKDQSSLGSCTAFATVGAYETLDPTWSGSELFLYYVTRQSAGTINQDVGASVSQAVGALHQYGVCSDSTWPYAVNLWNQQPSSLSYTEGLEHQTITYFHVDPTEQQLKACMTQGYPIVFGFMVYSSFESQSVAQTGEVPMPTAGEQLLGGHSVLMCGYDDSRGVYICKNSWGTSWGDQGYFYLPYAYISGANLASDFWVITSVETTGTGPVDPVVPPVDPVVPPVDPVVPPVNPKPVPRFRIIPKYKKDITPSDMVIASLKRV
jgi:C1A family cysteine protease